MYSYVVASCLCAFTEASSAAPVVLSFIKHEHYMYTVDRRISIAVLKLTKLYNYGSVVAVYCVNSLILYLYSVRLGLGQLY